MVNIRKSYSSSMSSKDLSDNDQSCRHDTDVLAAVALGAESFGAGLLRIKYSHVRNEQNPSGILPILAQWRERVSKKALRAKWAVEIKPASVAHQSFWHWLTPTCQTCHGRKHERITDTPILQSLVCPECGGTGERAHDCDRDELPHVVDSVETLRQIESIAAVSAIRKLG